MNYLRGKSWINLENVTPYAEASIKIGPYSLEEQLLLKTQC